MREAAHQRRAIERLEFVKFGGVDQSRDDLALVERPRQVGPDDAGDFGRIEQRRPRGAQFAMDLLHPAQGADDVAGLGDGFRLVAREMVRYA